MRSRIVLASARPGRPNKRWRRIWGGAEHRRQVASSVRRGSSGRAGGRTAAWAAAIDHARIRSRTSWSPRWSPLRRTRRTGRGRSMAERAGCPPRRSGGSGRRSSSSPTAPRRSNCRRTRLFVDKVYDVVGLYLNPPEGAVVLWVDEKSPGSGAGPLPAGVPDDARHAREADPRLRPARRHQPVRGVQHRRRHRDLAPAPPASHHRVPKFLIKIDTEVPARPRRPPGLRQLRHPQDPGDHATGWPRHPRFHMHFTPTYSSWINQVERWFAYLTDELIRRGDHRSVQALENRHPRLGQSLEHRPQTLHLDQDRRTDPRITRTTYRTN